MRVVPALVAIVALSALSGGCAVTQKLGLHIPGDPPVVVEGLRGRQTEAAWLREARLATPPGCAVDVITVLTDTDARFTFTCFGGGPNAGGL
ncbi:MAG: hypothetical protein NW200_03605 [Hyphomonadaceae bacterium]|nr:hypothetical protein [Hyphomonadaceae bacterium]